MSKDYSASKLKPKNRESYIINFRHPLIKDSKDKYGKKIRRGLGTTDTAEADRLVSQLNILLSDESYWNVGAKSLAESKFDERIVKAFYDDLDEIGNDYSSTRNKLLPLKTAEEGYAKVLLLGSTGSGKTTLLRQLMGTDPIKERFPATSTAKTTVFDTEIIFEEGNYTGVVTFYSESDTREFIKESIKNSMVKYFLSKNKDQASKVFLEDKDQRFRLAYILGKIKKKERFTDFDEFTQDISDELTDSLIVSEEEQKFIEEKITSLMQKIIDLSDGIEKDTFKILSNEAESLKDEDNDIIEELTLESIYDYEGDDLLDIIDEIIDEIKIRFNIISEGDGVFHKNGWLDYWKYSTDNREDFISKIKFFSSNSSPLFGRLLTPIVSGMRVSGPFKPNFIDYIPKLVIIDGEGLGHVADTTSNVPDHIIDKLPTANSILLVDNAQSPMQASPYSVIKAVSISGHVRKLSIAFTHFDLVTGDNLVNIQDKVDHIESSINNLLGKLQEDFEYAINKDLHKMIFNNSYYLANLDRIISDDKAGKFLTHQLIELIKSIESSVIPVEIGQAVPIYELSPLLFRLQTSAKKFHRIWDGYLGYSSAAGIKKAHFMTVKALTRRLGFMRENEFSYLRPLSDFWTAFNEQISYFLSNPERWENPRVSDDDKQLVINNIKQKVSNKIFEYAKENIKTKMKNDWQEAFEYRGRGSSYSRADRINNIYEKTVPVPEETISPEKKVFIKDLLKIITVSILEADGKFESAFDTK